jgi:hypothetical protein
MTKDDFSYEAIYARLDKAAEEEAAKHHRAAKVGVTLDDFVDYSRAIHTSVRQPDRRGQRPASTRAFRLFCSSMTMANQFSMRTARNSISAQMCGSTRIAQSSK